MNGEVLPPASSIPVITLANVTSLSNVLRELPMPKPIEPHGKNRSLLFNPQIREDVTRVLSSPDAGLIAQIAQVLTHTNVDHIELKDGYNSDTMPENMPILLQSLVSSYPNIFGRTLPTPPFTGLDSDVQEFLAQNFHPQTSTQSKQPQISTQSEQPFSQVLHPPAQTPHQTVLQQQTVQQEISPQPYCASPQHSLQHVRTSHYEPTPGSEPVPYDSHTETHFKQVRASPGVHTPSASHAPLQDPIELLSQTPNALSQTPVCRKDKKSIKKKKESSSRKKPVPSLQPLSSEDLGRYSDELNVTSTPHIKQSSHTSAPELQATPHTSTDAGNSSANISMPMVRITKLDIGAQQYQVAGEGLKLKIKKTDGTSKKKRHSSGDESDYSHHKKKKKKHKHHKEHKSLRREERVSVFTDDAETYTVYNLLHLIDNIIDNCSLDELPAHIDLTSFEEIELSPDVLVARPALNELINETAKLKAAGQVGSDAASDIPTERLGKLVTILQWNIRDGSNLIPTAVDPHLDERGQSLWQGIMVDRINRSLEAALASLYLMTAAEMPKVMYNEDLIELISSMVKFQLSNTIYPQYDPVYDIKKDKDYTSNKQKRNRSAGTKSRHIILMYNKLCDILDNLTDLLASEQLTDTIILKISSLAVQPFFVENISELQLSSIRLVTEIFSQYDKHRQLILDDMFLSLARLPTTKRNLRTYRLSHDEYIQMVTALVLQLIQCIIKLPTKSSNKRDLDEGAANDVVISLTYEQAKKTANHFLSVFLKKCAQRGEEDYRPLFDNFVNDLLVTANRPEWPAAELMLSMLGRLLVQQLSNKQVDMALRVASLDYLGTVAARLRRDAIGTKTQINEILEGINEPDEDDGTTTDNMDDVQKLQLSLLEYLLFNGQKDSALLGARNFFIAQWYRYIVVQSEKLNEQLSQIDPSELDQYTFAQEQLHENETKKQRLVELAQASTVSFKKSSCKIDYVSAADVTKLLTSQRPFAQSFDIYLAKILQVLSETAVAVRTKAIKCLALVIEADPAVLSRSDMQQAVHERFLDQSTSVREACVELVGKFILSRPELVAQYYTMLADRILDTGISVRKRVIKIFRDICVEMPTFEKIPDICVKMIRRVNDEEGIKKLVSEVFQSMWFTPLRDRDTDKLMRRVLNVTTVMSVIKDYNLEFMEHLMRHLLGKERDSSNKPMQEACRQIVDTLVMNIVKLEQKAIDMSEGKVTTSKDLVSSLSTLHLFSKIKPELMVMHADTLQPYLEIKATNPDDVLVLHHTSCILELVIPLIVNPRANFLSQVEEDLMALILRSGMTVVQSAISCLAAVVDVTNNYALVRDFFKKLQNIVFNCHTKHQADPTNPALQSKGPALKRSLFTIGVLCKHFDLDADGFELKSSLFKSIEELVFEQQMYFLWHEDPSIRLQALTALGFYCIRYYEKMMENRVKDLYHKLLTARDSADEIIIQILNNLGKYLHEEEDKMLKAEEHWKQMKEREDLKEMGDVQSGMASTVVQLYLKQVLESFFHPHVNVRTAAVNVVHLILKQGLIHPVQVIPYLIAMSTDQERTITIKADQHLQEIDKKHPGFIHMKAMAGMKMSYRLHKMIKSSDPLRGFRGDDQPQLQALNQHLYSLIRTNRTHRRALISSLLHLFDDTSTTALGELLFMADTLAYFPYQCADEPLFVIHSIDILVSVSGSNLLQAFKEGILTKSGEVYIPPPEPEEIEEVDPETGEIRKIKPARPTHAYRFDDDDDDDPESIYSRLPTNCSNLHQLIVTAQGCIFLIAVKQHLKDMYNITEGKLSKYSPTEAQKVWERPINRKIGIKFEPTRSMSLLNAESPSRLELVEEEKRLIVSQYIQFKQLMMRIDPNEDDEDKPAPSAQTPPPQGSDDNPIESFAAHEAETMAANMQPTISLMSLGLPPEYQSQLNNSSQAEAWNSDHDSSDQLESESDED